MLTPSEVAEKIGVSRSSVVRMIYSGDLPAIVAREGKKGFGRESKKTFRIREEVIERWVKRREQQWAERCQKAHFENAPISTNINIKKGSNGTAIDPASPDYSQKTLINIE